MKKTISIIILILLYISYIAFILYDNKDSNYILLGTNTIISYRDNEVKNIKRTSKVEKKLNFDKMYVYDSEKKFNEYYISIIKGESIPHYSIYNLYNEAVYLSTPLLAYKGDINIDVLDMDATYEITEEDSIIIDKMLKKYNVSGEITYFSKNALDIDNDNKYEVIYSLNNYGGIGDGEIFCFNFMEDSSGNIIEIDSVKMNANDYLNAPNKNFIWAIDLDSDKNYEIILSNTIGDDSITYYDFYKYDAKNKKFNIIFEE